MTMKRSGYRPSALPRVGICQRRLLMMLRASSYTGTPAHLATLVDSKEGPMWLALSGLAARRLVSAERAGAVLIVKITRAGRVYI
jgi:hypothetical protein